MQRGLQRLSVRQIETAKRAGYYADGGGLYLQVGASGSKSWIFRYTRAGRTREMGLGSLAKVSLARARKLAGEQRAILGDGLDPISQREKLAAQHSLERARSISFARCARHYIEAHQAKWKNAKHASQWTNTLETYCAPVFGRLPVQDVDTGLVLKALEPIWTEKPETSVRLRARIAAVLDWAIAHGYRAGENPARWRGHLDKLLPVIPKKNRVKHHAALPYDEIGAFTAELRQQEGLAAQALEFLILTVGRTGEVIGAKPEEFDLKKAVWTVPAARMKAGREHRVPLSPRAVELVKPLVALGADYVFPGMKKGTPLSSMALLMALRRMGRKGLTVHGFRSTFRDWAAERTNYPREVCEMSLAHAIGDKTEAAYRRGDLFEKRRRLMVDWERYCSRVARSGNVTPIRGKTATGSG